MASADATATELWDKLWQWSDGPLKGYVSKLEDFERIRHEFEIYNSLLFVSRR